MKHRRWRAVLLGLLAVGGATGVALYAFRTRGQEGPQVPVAGVAAPSLDLPADRILVATAPVGGSGAAGLREHWGIEVERLALLAGGTSLDLRYRVLDSAKAAGVAQPHNRAYLVDEATDTLVPIRTPSRLGALRQTGVKPRVGRTYSMVFPNPGSHFKRGGRVTLVLGAMTFTGMTVE